MVTASPGRTNDQETPYLLAAGLGDRFLCRGLDIDFDGGDFLITRSHVFAHPAVVEKNAHRPGGPAATAPDAIGRYLVEQFGRPVTWLGTRPDDAPGHHVGMYVTVIEGTAFVGDVRLADAIAASQPDCLAALAVAGGAMADDAKAELAGRLDRAARQLAALGYAVLRVPLLPSATPRAWMSYNNGIVETGGGASAGAAGPGAIYYMPTFAAPALDAAAVDVFRSAGLPSCRVVPIDCSTVWPLGGSLHCLVNVVARR
jgi:hypothetical protein